MPKSAIDELTNAERVLKQLDTAIRNHLSGRGYYLMDLSIALEEAKLCLQDIKKYKENL